MKLIREAWDFGNVPPGEIEPCYLYEYSKESFRITARIRRYDWFKLNPEPAEERQRKIWRAKSLDEIGDTITTTKLDYEVHFLVDLAESRMFPKKCWLEIEADPRRNILLQFGPDRIRWGHDPAIMETRRLLIQTLESFLDVRQRWSDFLIDAELPHRSGPQVFDACWARSDSKLLRDFAEWLKENRPKDQPGFQVSAHGGSRRTTPRDLLKALGAFRLIRHFNGDVRKARDHYHEVVGTFLYKDDSAWSKAKKKGLQEIRHFDKLVK